MQIEITLQTDQGADFPARDLGYLLHKHPDRLHQRDTAAGTVSIFFTEAGEETATAVLHLDVDPVGLVRGKNANADGLMDAYVNDRPYVANSFLSVAIGRALGQTMAGRSRERQALADRALPFTVRVVPVAVAGGADMVSRLFGPLGYAVDVLALDESGARAIVDLRLTARVRLADLLTHLYVLVPVLDNAKHWYIDRDEVEKLLDKGEGWLPAHPEKDLITRRALRHRRALVNMALARLAEGIPDDEDEAAPDAETALEAPMHLHDLRLDRVARVLKEAGAETVLDLGCGEGRLMRHLIPERGVRRIVGVDPSARALEVAARRLHLDTAGEAMRERVRLQMGSLTYGDRRWHGFDAAALVEVIEHVDPPRLSALALSVFGDARPRLVVITTPNRDYNVLFDGMAPDAVRHADHRFEWTRAEFAAWAESVAAEHDYAVRFEALGPEDATHGAPSQMAVFERSSS